MGGGYSLAFYMRTKAKIKHQYYLSPICPSITESLYPKMPISTLQMLSSLVLKVGLD